MKTTEEHAIAQLESLIRCIREGATVIDKTFRRSNHGQDYDLSIHIRKNPNHE